MPWLVQRGIDDGIPPLLDGGSGSFRPLLTVVLAPLATAAISAARFNGFLLIVGRMGQDVVLDIREDSTSTSSASAPVPRAVHVRPGDFPADVRCRGHRRPPRSRPDQPDHLRAPIGGIGVALLLMDLRLALVSLASFPILFVMTRCLPRPRRARLPRDARGGRPGDRPLRREPRRHPRGARLPREPRNQEIFEHLDDRYRRANNWSGRLAGIYGPGVQLVGRLTIALVLSSAHSGCSTAT